MPIVSKGQIFLAFYLEVDLQALDDISHIKPKVVLLEVLDELLQEAGRFFCSRRPSDAAHKGVVFTQNKQTNSYDMPLHGQVKFNVNVQMFPFDKSSY